jgi:outer membrane protein OmpA-like peptidoglycan-associated protein
MVRSKIVPFGIVIIVLFGMPIKAHEFHQRLGVGLTADAIRLIGGEKGDSRINGWAGLYLSYGVARWFTLSFENSYGWVGPRKSGTFFQSNPKAPFKTFMYYQRLNGQVHLPKVGPFYPFLTAGTGLIQWDLRNVSAGGSFFNNGFYYGSRVHDSLIWNVTVMGGIGTHMFITENLGLQTHLRYCHLFDQRDDNIGTNDANTAVLQFGITLSYYFFGWKDADGDGIHDKQDRAPLEPEDVDGFEDDDGVPEYDNDNDGIPDALDQLPLLPEDLDGFQDDDGVPELDNDWDGISDSIDQAPNDPEDFDGFEDEDGIPDLDNDEDGIPDLVDACPNAREDFNGYKDRDGCPDIVPPLLLQKGDKIVLKGVNFETGSTYLTEASRPVLDEVYVSLNANPEIVVEIRGHTDNVGSHSYNLKLSEERAKSVKTYLVDLGIERDRLITKGFGPDQPIASNATPEGRAKNRRIEFHRLK